jgi:predicted HicB family RNase H-like nuclease
MKGRRQEILKHDWQIFKARYMLAGEFKKVEEEFMALCEAECFEALSVYSATVNSRFNAKIHKMIASYPNNNPKEILQQ